MADLILFGMQGSGKGTQGTLLAERLGLTIFETGGQLRRLAAEESELGNQVREITTAGRLVPNEVVMAIVANFLNRTPKNVGVIFDGIPRSESQRVSLEVELQKFGRKPLAVYICLTREEALRRLLGRRTCANCKTIYGAKDNLPPEAKCPKCGGELKTRADDTEEAIRTRLEVYEKETVPVIEQYRGGNRLIEIDGSLPVEQVTTTILSALKNY